MEFLAKHPSLRAFLAYFPRVFQYTFYILVIFGMLLFLMDAKDYGRHLRERGWSNVHSQEARPHHR